MSDTEQQVESPREAPEEREREPREKRSKIPADVEKFLKDISVLLLNRGGASAAKLYDDFEELSQQYFVKKPWPPIAVVAEKIDKDETFILLYTEMYYRHVNTRLTVTIDDRIAAYNNYMKIFALFLELNQEDPALELPSQWLWDIFDEFVYQFQSFHHVRADIANLEKNVVASIKDHPEAWDIATTLRTVQALTKKGQFEAKKPAETTEEKDELELEEAQQPPAILAFFYCLGYYSFTALSRINCLLGDHIGALKALDAVDIRRCIKRNENIIVPTAASTLYYHIAVSALMLRRYADAVKHICTFLNFSGRLKQVPKMYYNQIKKKNERMYGMLCVLSTVFQQRIEDNIHHNLTQNHQESLESLQSSDLPKIMQFLGKVLPKFIAVGPTNFNVEEDKEAKQQDNQSIQLKYLEDDIKQREKNAKVFEQLKMCTAVTLSKLASFLETDEENAMAALLAVKHRSKVLRWKFGPLTSGNWNLNTETDYYIVKDVVQVNEHQPIKRNADYFVRNIIKADKMIADVQHLHSE